MSDSIQRPAQDARHPLRLRPARAFDLRHPGRTCDGLIAAASGSMPPHRGAFLFARGVKKLDAITHA